MYLEIGVREGVSFRRVRASKKVGVDVCRTESMKTLGSNEAFYELPSDRFFASIAEGLITIAPVDVALVDGLHTYEQAYRDIINASGVMNPSGVILVDDSYPKTADRANPEPTGRAWNGEVWKAMAHIVKEQPQWSVSTIDLDEGIGIVSGFGRSPEPFDRNIAQEIQSLAYEDLLLNPGLVSLKSLRKSEISSLLKPSYGNG